MVLSETSKSLWAQQFRDSAPLILFSHYWTVLINEQRELADSPKMGLLYSVLSFHCQKMIVK